MNVLYLVFGAHAPYHLQAHFSILGFLRHRAHLAGITVMTDAPAQYARLASHVRVQEVSPALLQEWKGRHDFFWRIKIKALEQLAAESPGTPLVYLDSDTFLMGALDPLAAPLAAGRALMHEREGALSTLASKTEKRMWRQVRGHEFGGVRMHEKHAMWNAGAVGIPGERTREVVEHALAICDDLCAAKVTPRLIEQFALSVALDESGPLEAASGAIGHYWSNKDEWSARIAEFFAESLMQQRSVDADIARLGDFDFRVLPVKRVLGGTRRRLDSFVSATFPPRRIEYAGD